MAWLSGGPFYELSFLVNNRTSPKETISSIIATLHKLGPSIEFAGSRKEIDESIDSYQAGYPYDEQDTNSAMIRSAQLDLWTSFAGRRRSALYIEEISDQVTCVDFCFYGDAIDSDVEGQPGLKAEDIPLFEEFFIRIFERFDFPAGTIGTEADAKDLFQFRGGWPNEAYTLDQLDESVIDRVAEGNSMFTHVLYNKSLFMLVELDPAHVKEEDRYYLIKNPKL